VDHARRRPAPGQQRRRNRFGAVRLCAQRRSVADGREWRDHRPGDFGV
jgi:hypothetical protein